MKSRRQQVWGIWWGIGVGLILSCTVAQAMEYAYVDVNVPFPGAIGTQVTDINSRMLMVGNYQDAHGTTWGWMLNPSKATFTALKHQHCQTVEVWGVNRSGHIVGTCYHTTAQAPRAFVRIGTRWHFLVVPGAESSEGLALSNTGLLAGSYRVYGDLLRKAWIFHLKTQTFELLDFAPGALETVITGITDAGDLGGFTGDTSTHQGWTELHGVVNPYVPADPTSQSNQIRDITAAQRLVGVYWAPGGIHSFVDLRGQFTPIVVPWAAATVVQGMNELMMAVGAWMDEDSRFYGFVATPQGRSADQVAGVMERARWVAQRYGAQEDTGQSMNPLSQK